MKTQSIPAPVQAREESLKALLHGYGTLAIAYSGGVDSAYLACVAHEVLGDRARLVLADSPSIPRSEVRDAVALAEARGWNLTVIPTTEFENEAFLKNDGTRCYYCKSELFTQMDAFAKAHGIEILAYGEIAEDRFDPTRLGARAAREHRVVAPLAEVGLHKEEIRRLSRARELPTWNKASFACLSSRFPTGTRVAPEEMSKVEAAEEVLRGLGFVQYRARHHGAVCRVEIDPVDFPRLLDEATRAAVLSGITRAGYRYVTLDLAGYRTGSTADPPLEG
ncbi:MAG: ATP-dependent sacrificial sulfur transferase LarE [Candidatus Hydrogenedentes bacterium]|nr:ATP-dependent sacrificial sulfur transferase LarE [Candidatus Hydrogenedentota bacterium]